MSFNTLYIRPLWPLKTPKLLTLPLIWPVGRNRHVISSFGFLQIHPLFITNGEMIFFFIWRAAFCKWFSVFLQSFSHFVGHTFWIFPMAFKRFSTFFVSHIKFAFIEPFIAVRFAKSVLTVKVSTSIGGDSAAAFFSGNKKSTCLTGKNMLLYKTCIDNKNRSTYLNF